MSAITSVSGSSVRIRPGRRDAIHHRHQHVHQHDIRLELERHPDGLGAVRRFADHLQLSIQREEHAQPLAYHTVVIGDENADWHMRPPLPTRAKRGAGLSLL